jgi:hypothetical protein
MPEQQFEPLIVPVIEARRLLGGIGHNRFWKLAKAGEVELVGTARKRFVVVQSIRAYVSRMPRRQPSHTGAAPAAAVRSNLRTRKPARPDAGQS